MVAIARVYDTKQFSCRRKVAHHTPIGNSPTPASPLSDQHEDECIGLAFQGGDDR